jgi:hypothetical protein
MDIRCPICGEPWDILTLHDEAEWIDETFDKVRERFYSDGCGKVFGVSCERSNDNASAIASLAYDIMGDDVDGIASMLEDAEFMGLI